MTYDPDIHHRRSIRLKDYDYSQAGAYFVTVCAWKKEYLFGEIKNGEMMLNECGETVAKCWDAIPDHFRHVELDEFVIMPNHVHGIIVLNVRAMEALKHFLRPHELPVLEIRPGPQLGPIPFTKESLHGLNNRESTC